jgi:hypothetical protein
VPIKLLNYFPKLKKAKKSQNPAGRNWKKWDNWSWDHSKDIHVSYFRAKTLMSSRHYSRTFADMSRHVPDMTFACPIWKKNGHVLKGHFHLSQPLHHRFPFITWPLHFTPAPHIIPSLLWPAESVISVTSKSIVSAVVDLFYIKRNGSLTLCLVGPSYLPKSLHCSD